MTEELQKCKSRCYFTLAYRAFVLSALLLIIYCLQCKENLLTREILVEELNSVQNNIITSISQNSKQDNEKTVIEVIKEQKKREKNSKITKNLVEDLREIQNRLKEKNEKLNALRIEANNVKKEIISLLSKSLDEQNLLSETQETENLADKSKKILSQFVTVKKIEDIKSDPQYILREDFKKLKQLFIDEDYKSIAELYKRAGELLEEEKYNNFSSKISEFAEENAEISVNSEIENLIKKLSNDIEN